MNKNVVFKNFLKYMSLNVLGMIGLSCYILADTFFVSKALGANGLAALNFSISIYCIVSGAGLMIGMGGATKYAILKAQNEHEAANAMFTHTFMLGVGVGIVFALIGMFLTTPIAKLLGADQSTLSMTVTYLTTILCFAPCFILNNVFIAFIRNDGSPKLSMAAMLVGSLSNILLDYVFIFPFSMGMFGAAFATGLAPVISMGILSLHFIKKHNQFRFVRSKIRIKYIGDVLSLGLSAFITEVSSGVVLIVFNLVILGLEGNVGIAAYGIVANFALVGTAIFTGIAQGIQPLASNGYGMKDQKMLKHLLGYAFILSSVIATMMYVLVFIGSENIIAAFNSENNRALIPIATDGFKLYFMGFFFAGLNIIACAFLSATEQPRKAFLISIIRGCVAIIPLVFILSRLLGMKGVWLSFVFAEIIAATFTIVHLFHLKKLRVEVEPLN